MSHPKDVKMEAPARSIDVFCKAHNLSFTVEATSHIACENSKHELDHAFPHATFWEYCCDCQTFVHCDIAKERKVDESCPSCTRQFARRFVCDKCHIITCESDAPARRKAFSFAPEGAPPPTCPGCLAQTTGATHGHECLDFGFTFLTARRACPFCLEAVSLLSKTESPVQPPSSYQPPTGGAEPDEIATTSPTLNCPNCHVPIKAHFKFCKKCRAPLQSATTPVAASHARDERNAVAPVTNRFFPSAAQNAPPPDPALEDVATKSDGYVAPEVWKNKKFIAGGAIIVVLMSALLISAAYRATSSGFSTEGKLTNAIARGNLVAPVGDSAHDYYNQLKSEGASATALSRFNAQLIPALTARAFKMLEEFAVPGNADRSPAEWEEAGKSLTWASELAPNDGALAAKAAYCTGRSAYIRKQSDTALDLWGRAADLDRTWALPPNGVGLIYNESKRWATARKHFREAISRNPNWAIPHNNMGTSYFYEKNYDEAATYYQRAAELAPQWARPHAWLGEIAYQRKDYCGAQQEYQSSLTLATEGMSNWDPVKIQEKRDRAAAKCVQLNSAASSPQRITFSAGGTTATVNGSTSDTDAYVISVQVGQTMTLSLTTDANNATLRVLDAEMNPLNTSTGEQTSWTGTLSYTGDYNILVVPTSGTAVYMLHIAIPPLS